VHAHAPTSRSIFDSCGPSRSRRLLARNYDSLFASTGNKRMDICVSLSLSRSLLIGTCAFRTIAERSKNNFCSARRYAKSLANRRGFLQSYTLHSYFRFDECLRWDFISLCIADILGGCIRDIPPSATNEASTAVAIVCNFEDDRDIAITTVNSSHVDAYVVCYGLCGGYESR